MIVIIAAVIGTLACSGGTLLSRQEEPTATPTKTPKPTFTATLPPTDTPIPTNTPLPTDTPTPVTPTETPVVHTATFTPEPPTDTPLPPTDTPVPPTNTPKPTARPRPRPTKTPTPKPQPTSPPPPQYAWRGTVIGTYANCGITQVYGYTLDRNGGMAGDIWVHYWADGWNGGYVKSSWVEDKGASYEGDEKNWDGLLADYARGGTWYVCVVAKEGDWDCISDRMTVQTVETPCAPDSGGIQVARIVFQQN
jgi:hypothetical protein